MPISVAVHEDDSSAGVTIVKIVIYFKVMKLKMLSYIEERELAVPVICSRHVNIVVF